MINTIRSMANTILNLLSPTEYDAEPSTKRSQESVVGITNPNPPPHPTESDVPHPMEDPNPRSQSPDPAWKLKGFGDSRDVNYRLSPEKLADQDTPTNDDYIPTQQTPVSEQITQDGDVPTPVSSAPPAQEQPGVAPPAVVASDGDEDVNRTVPQACMRASLDDRKPTSTPKKKKKKKPIPDLSSDESDAGLIQKGPNTTREKKRKRILVPSSDDDDSDFTESGRRRSPTRRPHVYSKLKKRRR